MQIKDFTPQNLFPKMLPTSFWENLRKEVPSILEEQLNPLTTPDVIRMPVEQLNQHKDWLLAYLKQITEQLPPKEKEKITTFNQKAIHAHLDACIATLSKSVQTNLLNYIKMQYHATVANKAISLTEKTIETTLHKHPVVLIDFWATWCAPCKALAPTINQLIDHYQDRVYFGKVDIDQAQALAQRYQVQSIPTLLLFKNGTLATKFMGNQPFNQLKKALDELLAD